MEPATKTDNNLLLDQARTLVTELEAGNDSAAGGLIEELSRMREQTLFQELGKMTRQLHDSLTSFAVDSRMQSLAESDIPDAKATTESRYRYDRGIGKPDTFGCRRYLADCRTVAEPGQ